MRLYLTFAVVGIFVYVNSVFAQMSSTNYRIRWDSVTSGGSDTSSSSSYLLRDSVENVSAGSASSTNYELSGGYRAGVFDQIITFNLLIQNLADARGATALSNRTVTTDITGLSVGDYIAIVQDPGTSQISAIGQIASFGSGTLTVDIFKNGGTSPTVDGVRDSVYPLNATSVAWGDLTISDVKTALLAFEVSIENNSGYVVQVMEDGNFRTSENDINDVSDGTVTTGSEEYGARSSDTSLSGSTFDTVDTAMTTSFQDIATESSTIFESRNFLTLKAAISSGTPPGNYAHTVSIIASGNY